jgi:hypothetical protein
MERLGGGVQLSALADLRRAPITAICPELIFPTFGGHLRKGILALNEVLYGTQRLQAVWDDPISRSYADEKTCMRG